MTWEDSVTQLYGLADRVTGMVERDKTLSFEEAVKLPEVHALQEQLAKWFKQPGNAEGLIAASERARSEHRKLAARLQQKRERKEPYTAQEVEQLMALWEADTTLSKEALGKAGEMSEILRFTAAQLMPWLKLAAKLSLIPVKDPRAKAVADVVMSFMETPPEEPEARSVDEIEGAILQVLSGVRALRDISTEYGTPCARLLRLAVRYSDAGRTALMNEVVQPLSSARQA